MPESSCSMMCVYDPIAWLTHREINPAPWGQMVASIASLIDQR
jgi:hypothetical protein